MDLSDGLLGDLPKILVASGVSAVLNEADIPVAAAVHALFPDDYVDMATRGGEDYELLFTAPAETFARIEATAAGMGMPVAAIGRIEAAAASGPELWLEQASGSRRQVTPGAWDHFSTA
jgi:thiamine-monophosphate kinase